MTTQSATPARTAAPYAIGATAPDKTAFVMPDGVEYDFATLERQSRRVADVMRSLALGPGDHIALMMENRFEFVVLCWAAQRAGLYYTPIATHLKAEEARYIVRDSGARLVTVSARFEPMWRSMRSSLYGVRHWRSVDQDISDFPCLFDADEDPLQTADVSSEREGSPMLYSSGTTGRPKGIKKPLSPGQFGSEPIAPMYRDLHRLSDKSVYLSPAPLYHAAPLRCVMAAHRLGATTVVMEKFDAEDLLRAIDFYRVTHVQLVPTMLHRVMALPLSVRARYDVSSLECVIHAAAPCPIPLKQAAIDWLGPIVNEYYGGTEGAGATYITAREWKAHPGSVGRAFVGKIHIVSEAGEALPVGQTGLVYFAGGPPFTYHNAPEKMAEVVNDKGWVTLGDIGKLDEDGYLYLLDRRAFVINSGGVNIYPIEVEEVLLTHPLVADAAVIGAPSAAFGEEVKAVVELRDTSIDASEMEANLIAYCRARLSNVKCPRSVDFVSALPRSDSGKLLKAEVKRRYWHTG